MSDLPEAVDHAFAVAVLELIDRTLDEGGFAALDRLIAELAPSELSTRCLIAVLNGTYPARDRLPSRAAFVDVVDMELRLRLGDERAERLMKARR